MASKSMKNKLFVLLSSVSFLVLALFDRSYGATHAYVTNSFDNSVSVVRTSDKTVTTTIDVGDWPYGVGISPDGEYVYVTNGGDNTVSVIRTFNNEVTTSINVGNSPGGVAVSPNGAYVYVTNNDDNTVSVIRTSDHVVTATIDVGTWPEGVAVSPNGDYVYVVNTGDDTISVISTAENSVTSTIIVGRWPYGVAISANGQYVYVTNTSDNTVSVISTFDHTVTASIEVGARPIGIEVVPDDQYVYVANSRDNTVSAICTSDHEVSATIDVGTWPWGLAVTPNGESIYVSNLGDDTVSVIKTADNSVINTVGVGIDPYNLGKFVADIPDDIKWVSAAIADKQIGISGKANVTNIDSISSVDPENISDTANKPDSLPFGLISFELKVEIPGDTAEVVIYFSEALEKNVRWHKYDLINGWQDYSPQATFSPDRRSVTLKLKDGDYGDSDGTANGIIVDPGGPGLTLSSSPNSDSKSGGSGGGCFIATAAYVSPTERHVKILRKFRDCLLLTNHIGEALVKLYYRYFPPLANFIARYTIFRTAV